MNRPLRRSRSPKCGYDTVSGAASVQHRDAAPAPIYELDTRSEHRLRAFLDRVTQPRPGGTAAAQSEVTGQSRIPAPAFTLTSREQEVADLLVQGSTNAEIAAALFISEATVKKHINAMLYKTSRKNRTQPAAVLLEAGWSGLDMA